MWTRFPLVYEINTRVWLAQLALECGRRVTLADIPDEEFRNWSDLHFDAIWLMGVWQPSEIQPRARIARPRVGSGSH